MSTCHAMVRMLDRLLKCILQYDQLLESCNDFLFFKFVKPNNHSWLLMLHLQVDFSEAPSIIDGIEKRENGKVIKKSNYILKMQLYVRRHGFSIKNIKLQSFPAKILVRHSMPYHIMATAATLVLSERRQSM